MSQQLSHIAMTVPRSAFTAAYHDELFHFYGELLGWHEDPSLSIKDERLFIRLPEPGQYLNVRASDEPMSTSGYEHLGIYVDSAEEVRDLHDRAKALARDPIEIDDQVQVLYGERLHTFRMKYLLPLAVEVQFVDRG